MVALSSFKLLAAVIATAYLSTSVEAGISIDQVRYDSYCGHDAYPDTGVICFDTTNFLNEVNKSPGSAAIEGYWSSDGAHLAIIVGDIGRQIVWKTSKYEIALKTIGPEFSRHPCVAYIITSNVQGEKGQLGDYCNGDTRPRLFVSYPARIE